MLVLRLSLGCVDILVVLVVLPAQFSLDILGGHAGLAIFVDLDVLDAQFGLDILIDDIACISLLTLVSWIPSLA
jgi:hypothetical protein